MKSYWVYMMTNVTRHVLYVGVTNDMGRRWWEHFAERNEGFTQKYNCHILVYYEEFHSIVNAIEREKQLKGWTRAKKEALINKVNPRWEDYTVLFGWKH